MTLAEAPLRKPDPPPGQHLYLGAASWDAYQSMLAAVEGSALRVSYLDGELEVMAPGPDHEYGKKHIAQLIELMTLELDIERACLGSTTFASADLDAGLEPDECYYFGDNVARVRNMTRFDPALHPAPDLAVEIESSRRVVDRLAIYHRLGVKELWIDDGTILRVLLHAPAAYAPSDRSAAFPFLPMADFTAFAHRMRSESQNAVLKSFRAYLATLPR